MDVRRDLRSSSFSLNSAHESISGSAIATPYVSACTCTRRLQEAQMNLKAFGSAATLSFSVALGGVMLAQTPTPQPGTPAQRPSAQDAQTVTVTGCLVRASDLRGGATGAPATGSPTTPSASAGAGGDFALANVQMRSTSPGGTTGGTTAGGTTAGGAAASPSSKGMNLRLTGSEENKLSEHVNQQVEVTGRLSMSDRGGATATPGTTGTPGTPGTPGTTGSAGAAGAGAAQSTMGQLQVQTIRATGQSCTAGGGQ
jgi:hypothetical protein